MATDDPKTVKALADEQSRYNAQLGESVGLVQQLNASINSLLNNAKAIAGLFGQFKNGAENVKEVATQFEAAADKAKPYIDTIKAADIEAFLDGQAKSAKDVASSMKDAGSSVVGSSGQMTTALNLTGNEIDTFFGKSTKLTDQIKEKYPAAFAIGGAALDGMRKGFTTLVATGKGLIEYFSSIVSAAWKVTKALISIPFRLFSVLIDMSQQSGGGTNELAVAFEKLREQFGAFKDHEAKNVIDGFQSMQGELAKTGVQVYQVFTMPADRLKYLTELATKMGATFNVLASEVGKNAEVVAAYQKGLGILMDDMAGVSARAIAFGQTMEQQFYEVANMSMQMGKTFGISSKMVSRDVGKMMKDVKNFGNLSIKEMTETSIYVRKLGVEFEKLQGIVDKWDSFESAAEAAAKLSQAFGVNVNAFEMMEKQNPADRLDELRDAFKRAGKSAETMSRQELKLIADATGLDEATARLALSSGNAGTSMDEIKKSSEAAQKQQMSQTEVMKRLGDQIERMIPSGGGGEKFKSFWDAFTQGISRGVQNSPEFIELMMKMRNALWSVFRIGMQLGRELPKLFAPLGDGLRALSSLMPDIIAQFQGISDSIRLLLKSGNFDEFVKNMRTSFERVAKSDVWQRLQKAAFEGLSKLSTIAAAGLRWFAKTLAEGIHNATEFLTHPEEFLGKMQSGGSEFAKKFISAIQPLIDVIKDEKTWLPVWEALKQFAPVLWKKIQQALWWVFNNTPKSVWIGAGAALFGPAAVKTFATFAGAALPGMVSSAFASSSGATASAASSGMGAIFGNPYVLAAAATAALTVAGIGISKGIEKFDKDISDKIIKLGGDRKDSKFGSGTAGLVQMLSFGTMSDETGKALAENLAELSKTVFKTLGEFVGPDFAADIKEFLFAGFGVLGSIGNIVRSLFKGDGAGVVSGMVDAFKGLFIMFITRLKVLFITLPTKIIELVSSALEEFNKLLDVIINPNSAGAQTFIDNFGKAFADIAENLGPVFDGLWEGVKRLVIVFFDKLMPALADFCWKLPLAVGIALKDATNAIFSYFGNVIKTFGTKVLALVPDFKMTFMPLITAIELLGVELAQAAVGMFKTFVSSFGPAGDVAMKALGVNLDEKTTQLNAHHEKLLAKLGNMRSDYAKEQQKTAEAAKAAEKKSGANSAISSGGLAGISAKVTAAAPTKLPGLTEPSKAAAPPSEVLAQASAMTEQIQKAKANLEKISEKDAASMQEKMQKLIDAFSKGGTEVLNKMEQQMTKIASVFSSLDVVAKAMSSFSATMKSIGDPQGIIAKFYELYGQLLKDFPEEVMNPAKVKSLDETAPVLAKMANIATNMSDVAEKSMKMDPSQITAFFKNIINIGKQMEDAAEPITISMLGGQTAVAAMTAMMTTMSDYTKAIQTNLLTVPLNVTSDMVKKANELADTINMLATNPKISNIKENLQKLGTSLGVNRSYTVGNDGVKIQLNLHVVMEAAKLESVLLTRSDALIQKAFIKVPKGNEANDVLQGGGGG